MKKNIIITGASVGIGKDIAITLAQQGHCVYALARRVELMEPLKEYGIVPIKVDITSPKNIHSAVKEILDRNPCIDVLINNAGYGFYEALEDCTIDKAKELFEVNVFGLMEMTKSVLPTMRAQCSGTIINISSVVGKVPLPYMGWYGASKHAVEALSDVLRFELAPFHIHVVLIEPGHILSEFGQTALDTSGFSVNSPYQQKIEDFQNLTENNPIPADKPDSISRTVTKIINSPRPKTRYRPNLDAKILVFFKKYFGDRIVDWLFRFKL